MNSASTYKKSKLEPVRRRGLETVQTVDVFPEVKLTSGRRLVIIDSSVDEVARLEADRKELQKPLCGIF
jgi:hypothetical protein